jgi:hypothetical protein
MAEYNVSTVASEIKPPQVTSIGDMLNIARGATAYQKEKALLEPAIAKGQAESEEAQVRLNNAKLENTRKHYENIAQNTADLMLKPDLKIDDIIERASQINANAGGNQQSLKQYLAGLPQNGKPIELKAWLAQAQAKALTAQAQIEKQYPAGILPGQLTETSSQAGASQGMGGQGAAPTSAGMELQYPVRNPQTPYLPIQGEEDAVKVGSAYQAHASDVAGRLPKVVRNNQELISSIKTLQKDVPELFQGGIGGQARLEFLKAKGDPRVAQLQKNLDNVIASTVTTFGKDGLSTDAGKALTAASVGKLNMPLDVLLNTAYRASSDLKNSELEAKAVSKFTKQFGVNNIASFQKTWGENADTDVLQLMAMEDLGANPKEIDEFVFKGKSKAQIEDMLKKENNIKKLTEKGHL